jgi:hypothetical protein
MAEVVFLKAVTSQFFVKLQQLAALTVNSSMLRTALRARSLLANRVLTLATPTRVQCSRSVLPCILSRPMHSWGSDNIHYGKSVCTLIQPSIDASA